MESEAKTKRYDYALERRLRELDKDLHARFSNTVFALQRILSNYKLLFPSFTDHSELHTLNVIDFCNRLVGERLNKMNADEIYCLLLGCYFHDTGMGITKNDYEEFSKQIDFGDYFETHSKEDAPMIIREFHNEFSGLFIRKYARFFELPSPEHLFAIIEISRGHRKTNLFDDQQYPIALIASHNGNPICVKYLSALVRLADEIDVTASRNPHLIFDLSKITENLCLIEFMKHEAVKDLLIDEKEFKVLVDTKDESTIRYLSIMTSKMQKTLDECREAVNQRTPYEISQEKVVLKFLD